MYHEYKKVKLVKNAKSKMRQPNWLSQVEILIFIQIKNYL